MINDTLILFIVSFSSMLFVVGQRKLVVIINTCRKIKLNEERKDMKTGVDPEQTEQSVEYDESEIFP